MVYRGRRQPNGLKLVSEGEILVEKVTQSRGHIHLDNTPQWDGIWREGHHLYELQKWKDAFKGHRCFVIGTGPSLTKVPRELLEKLCEEYCFGLNLIVKCGLPFQPQLIAIFLSEWRWRDDIGIPDIIEMLKGSGKELPPIKVYSHERPLDELTKDGWVYIPCHQGKRVEDSRFEGLGTYLRRVGFGYSVALTAIQFACWVGFTEVYLLGCDGTSKGHAYDEDAEIDKRGDQSGFHRSAVEAERIMREAGRTLVDLTEGGALPIAKGHLSEVLDTLCPCGYRGR